MHKPALSICSPSVLHWIPKPIIDSIHIQSLLYLLLWFGVFNYKTCRNTSKDLGHNSRTIFLVVLGTQRADQTRLGPFSGKSSRRSIPTDYKCSGSRPRGHHFSPNHTGAGDATSRPFCHAGERQVQDVCLPMADVTPSLSVDGHASSVSPRDPLCLRPPPLENHPPLPQPIVPIPPSQSADSSAILAGCPVVAPTSSALRAELPDFYQKRVPGHIRDTIARAVAGPALGCDFRLCLREQLLAGDYTPAAADQFLSQRDKSVRRYNSAFVLFFKPGCEVGFSFSSIGKKQMVSVLGMLFQHSMSQARSAYAAIVMFPSMSVLRFDPAIRAMKQQSKAASQQYAAFWCGTTVLQSLMSQPANSFTSK